MAVLRYLIVRFREEKKATSMFDPKHIFPFFFLAYMIDSTIFTSVKTEYPDKELVGRDLFITVVGGFLPFFAQVGAVFYFFVVTRCLESYTTMMNEEKRGRLRKQFAWLSAVCWVIPSLSAVFSFVPAIGLFYPDIDHSIFAMVYLIGSGATMWLYGILTAFTLRCLILELRSHVKSYLQCSADLHRVLWRLSFAYYVLIYNCFTIGGSLIVFGISDYLRARSTYLLVFDAVFCPIGATVLILTVSKISYTPDRVILAASIPVKLFFRTLRSPLKILPFIQCGRVSETSNQTYSCGL